MRCGCSIESKEGGGGTHVHASWSMSLVQSTELSHSRKSGSSSGSRIEDIARSGGAGSWEALLS